MPRKNRHYDHVSLNDNLTDAVYRRAGFPPARAGATFENVLEMARSDVIRARTGQVKPAAEDVRAYKVMARSMMEQERFDKVMQAAILGRDHISEIGLFLTHEKILCDERARLRPALQAAPTGPGTYNRAKLAMNEDIEAIDEAIAAGTGRQAGNRR